jgi:hypothetical protein
VPMVKLFVFGTPPYRAKFVPYRFVSLSAVK